MKTRILILLVICLFAAKAMNASGKDNRFSVDASSALMYLNMAMQAENGTLPSVEKWDSLFNSTAYKALLDKTSWDKTEFKNNLRRSFEIVYNPQLKTQCDSIAATLNDLENLQDELPLFVSTALDIRRNLDKYTKILATTDMDSVIEAANSMALELVPDNGKGLTPQSSPIYFIVWDLECRALNAGLFLDVNTFFHNGLQAATEALAHELHHFYLGPVFETVYQDDLMDGAAAALAFNMREGVADIINKKQMPLTSLVPYGEKMMEKYNADYFSSPKVLEELDSITCSYLDNRIPADEYFRQAIDCAHYEGHTTGDFMVFLIRDHLGIDAVVASVGDLDTFIDNYNKAAMKAGTYVFSPRFTNHIHAISRAARKNP